MIDGCVDLQTFLRSQLGVEGTHDLKSHAAEFGILVADYFDSTVPFCAWCLSVYSHFGIGEFGMTGRAEPK